MKNIFTLLFRNPLFPFFLFHVFTTQAQTFNGVGGALPDLTVSQFTIPVSGLVPPTIDSTFGLQAVRIRLNHTYDGDLQISLISPDGTIADLAMNEGGGGNNFYTTWFVDTAAQAINQGSAPFNAYFRPDGWLGDVNNGQNGNGNWTLKIADVGGGDTGVLVSWRLVFSSMAAQPFPFQSSNLPLLLINTNHASIPDNPQIVADMKVIDNGAIVRNHLNDAPNGYDGKIKISLRGSSSQWFPQKSYALSTVDNATTLDTNVSLLGMPAENDWVLYAPYTDKTCMRNSLIYDLANEMGNYAPHGKFCEVFINGSYRGIYILYEKIKRDANRVDIAKLLPGDTTGDNLTGGYILKVDKQTGNFTQGFTSPYKPCEDTAVWQSIYFQYHYPKFPDMQPQQVNYIQQYVGAFEDALRDSMNWLDTAVGYRHYLDVPSAIDFSLTNEISRNVDGYRLSSYLYKDKDSRGGKLHMGPIWDFNLAFGNADYYNGVYWNEWEWNFWCPFGDGYLNPFWWKRFLDDTAYVQEYKCRYTQLRQNTFSLSHITTYIDSCASLLGEAKDRHFLRWKILGVYVWPNPYLPLTYQEEVDTMKRWISARLNWMDSSLIDTACLIVPTGMVMAESNQNIRVFPNPFDESFTIGISPGQLGAEWELTDILGRKLISGRMISVRQKILSNGFPAGIYFLRVGNFEEKIVKE